eukprot:Filipodium_phascolosomae@DN6812_c0_g1_i1.p1
MTPTKSARRKDSLRGKIFCITGTLSVSRKVAESMIRRYGGEYRNTVSSMVTHLVSARSDTSKAHAGKHKEIIVISERELIDMILGGSDGAKASKSTKKGKCCELCGGTKSLNSKATEDGPLLCSQCGFECLCGFNTPYSESLCCLEGIGPYCEACWEDPETNNCKCNHEEMFLKLWKAGDAKWLGGEAK